ncbi:transposable element Tcb2 transposase [Trichonephila clavipes]|nr:transposable element Tcb2 transposase [Trichonephila clavipes]
MKTTAADEPYVLQTKSARYYSASAIAQQPCTATEWQVSWLNVARRLQKGGLFAHRPETLHPFENWRSVTTFIVVSVIGNLYCKEVILPLFRGAIEPDFVFIDDNVRPRRTADVQQLLESEDITRIDGPVFFPDLSPVEYAWDYLEIRLTALFHSPENTQQLKQMLIEEWSLLPRELLDNLVLSMERRCEATIAVREGHIPY